MSKDIPSIEQTYIMIKPDGVERGLVGDIYSRFEKIGLKMVAVRMVLPTQEQARGNYPGTDEWLAGLGQKTYDNYEGDEEMIKADLGTLDRLSIGNKIYDGLVEYLTSSPVILSVWEGNHAVKVVGKLIGKTDPSVADVGSIRGDYGFDTPQFAVKSGRIVFKNLIHASDSVDEAKREIKHWFGDKFKDLGDYDRVDYKNMY